MKIIKEGFLYVVTTVITSLIFVVISLVVIAEIFIALKIFFFCLGVLSLLAAVFCLYFFRDPKIKIVSDENSVLSPCNGTVLAIDENSDENVIRVFLSIFDVHLQRSPVSGIVKSVEHKKGKFLMAMRPEAHSVNEQNIIQIESAAGTFTVRQIAGFIARRCISRVKSGDVLSSGDMIGLIKFGSQVDLHLPKAIAIPVKKGDTVRAGITVVGRI